MHQSSNNYIPDRNAGLMTEEPRLIFFWHRPIKKKETREAYEKNYVYNIYFSFSNGMFECEERIR